MDHLKPLIRYACCNNCGRDVHKEDLDMFGECLDCQERYEKIEEALKGDPKDFVAKI